MHSYQLSHLDKYLRDTILIQVFIFFLTYKMRWQVRRKLTVTSLSPPDPCLSCYKNILLLSLHLLCQRQTAHPCNIEKEQGKRAGSSLITSNACFVYSVIASSNSVASLSLCKCGVSIYQERLKQQITEKGRERAHWDHSVCEQTLWESWQRNWSWLWKSFCPLPGFSLQPASRGVAKNTPTSICKGAVRGPILVVAAQSWPLP